MSELSVNVDININQLAAQLDHSDAKELIHQIDDFQCDFDFTKDVVMTMIGTMAQCMSKYEYQAWTHMLAQMEHNHYEQEESLDHA